MSTCTDPVPEEDEEVGKQGSWGDRRADIQHGIATIKSIAKTCQHPDIHAVANVLESVGVLAMGALPPPWNLVCGGVLGAVGGLLDVFAPQPKKASSEDIAIAVQEGFRNVHIDLERIASDMTEMKDMTKELVNEVRALYKDLHLGDSKMRRIDATYQQHMNYLQAAGNDSSELKEAMEITKQALGDLNSEVYNTFTQENIDAYLKELIRETNDDVFFVQQALHHVIATRIKLYTMQSSIQIYRALLADKQTHNKQTNKQTSKQTSKPTNKQASKQTSKQTNKTNNQTHQTSKQTHKQANKQTSKQTNKQTKRGEGFGVFLFLFVCLFAVL